MNDTCIHDYVDCHDKYDVCRECGARWTCTSFERDDSDV